MRNFNIYDPMKRGQNLVLDGQTLAHLELLVNNDGGQDGTLLSLLQRCATPSGENSVSTFPAFHLVSVQYVSSSRKLTGSAL